MPLREPVGRVTRRKVLQQPSLLHVYAVNNNKIGTTVGDGIVVGIVVFEKAVLARHPAPLRLMKSFQRRPSPPAPSARPLSLSTIAQQRTKVRPSYISESATERVELRTKTATKTETRRPVLYPMGLHKTGTKPALLLAARPPFAYTKAKGRVGEIEGTTALSLSPAPVEGEKDFEKVHTYTRSDFHKNSLFLSQSARPASGTIPRTDWCVPGVVKLAKADLQKVSQVDDAPKYGNDRLSSNYP